MNSVSEMPLDEKADNEQKSHIVFLTSGGELYWIIANALVERFGPITIIQEEAEPKGVFLKRRIKILGRVAVIGQVAFGILAKFIYRLSWHQHYKIISDAGANSDFPGRCSVVSVPSVNSRECRQALKSAAPDVVMVVGTRIISKPTLSCIDAPFINYHPGLTPKYRGMNGAYWTLSSSDAESLAITMHLVDEGVDTGDILYQERVVMPSGNNVTTYHHYMAVEARQWAVKAIEDVLSDRLKPFKSDADSRQWFHPTLWDYLWCGLTKGVW